VHEKIIEVHVDSGVKGSLCALLLLHEGLCETHCTLKSFRALQQTQMCAEGRRAQRRRCNGWKRLKHSYTREWSIRRSVSEITERWFTNMLLALTTIMALTTKILFGMTKYFHGLVLKNTSLKVVHLLSHTLFLLEGHSKFQNFKSVSRYIWKEGNMDEQSQFKNTSNLTWAGNLARKSSKRRWHRAAGILSRVTVLWRSSLDWNVVFVLSDLSRLSRCDYISSVLMYPNVCCCVLKHI
jgi:hypothetical protein